MGNPDASWWYERDGIIRQEKTISFDTGKLRTGLEVIANQLGKKLDEDNPLLNAQLPDGSRLAAVIPPVVRPSPALTIRKFTSRHYTVDDLINRGTLTRPLAGFLAEQIHSGKTFAAYRRGSAPKVHANSANAVWPAGVAMTKPRLLTRRRVSARMWSGPGCAP